MKSPTSPPQRTALWSCSHKLDGWLVEDPVALRFAAMFFESFAYIPVTEDLLRHVWEGEVDTNTGGHRFGLGREGKTEFPPTVVTEHGPAQH